MSGLVVVCLLAAGVLVAWPHRAGRSRWRRLAGDMAGSSAGRLRVAGPPSPVRPTARRPRRSGRPHRRPSPAGPSRIGSPVSRPAWRRLSWHGPPGRWRGLPFAALVAAGATVLGGPVAGLTVGAYGLLVARRVAARAHRRALADAHRALVDQLAGAAADLRAGMPVDRALPVTSDAEPAGPFDDGDPVSRLRDQIRSAVTLAERTGAPLADLLERIEVDARAAERLRTAAGAQTTGAQATAVLLAVLPVGGVALGYAVGADPLAFLLHTPAGAACAVGALLLQMAGLSWTRRLMRPVEAA